MISLKAVHVVLDRVKQFIWLGERHGAFHRVLAEMVPRFDVVEEVKASDIPKKVYHLYIPTGKTKQSVYGSCTREHEYVYAGDVRE